MTALRIAIAHQDPATVQALRGVIAANPRLTPAWAVGTAVEAVGHCAADHPDVLLLQMGLPGFDTAEATRRIMKTLPCAILVVCDAQQAASRAPYAALAAGALDAVSSAEVFEHPQACPLALKLAQLVSILAEPKIASAAPAPAGLLVIGASTGGPAAVATLLRMLPAPLDMPCVVIQHIDREFAPGMAHWLQAETGHSTSIAVGGETLRSGSVFLAGGEGHLLLDDKGRLANRSVAADSPYQPSIDEFFFSACNWPTPAHAVLLTGMGRDGARGLAALRHRRWTTFAQTPSSCAVRGMPQAAIDLGAAQHVLAPEAIGAFLRHSLRKPNSP